MASLQFCLFFFLCLYPLLSSSHNVTHILSGFPSYSLFNSLLTKYGLASQINSRKTITLLCPQNAILSSTVSSLGSSPDAQDMFNVLSYHLLLDYFDPQKLKNIVNGSALVATLYQTTGLAQGSNGFVNITDVKGVAMIGLPVKHARPTTTIGKPLALYPYNISFFDVSAVLVPIGVEAGAPAPAPARVNITQVIAQGGNYTTFISLIQATGVDDIFQKHDMPPGITVFVPTNAAFDKLPKGALGKLTSAQKVNLLEYHAMPTFYSMEALGTVDASQNTLASGPGGDDYLVKVSTKGTSPILNTGFDKASVGDTLYSQNPVAIFGIDSVLMPSEIFGLAPTTAPAPSPFSPSPSPSPFLAPSPSPSPAPASVSSPASSPSPPAPPPGATIAATPASSPHSSHNHAAPPLLAYIWVLFASFMVALLLL